MISLVYILPLNSHRDLFTIEKLKNGKSWSFLCQRNSTVIRFFTKSVIIVFKKLTTYIENSQAVMQRIWVLISKLQSGIMAQLLDFGFWCLQFEKCLNFVWISSNAVHHTDKAPEAFYTAKITSTLFIYNTMGAVVLETRNIGRRGCNGRPGTSKEVIQQVKRFLKWFRSQCLCCSRGV